MPAEVGIAAFVRLRGEGLLSSTTRSEDIEKVLREPLTIDGAAILYRFPSQKACYLEQCLKLTSSKDLSGLSPQELRHELRKLPGVGLKTASWIVRNWMDSDDVAILDVHVIRAMKLLGLIATVNLAKEYEHVEGKFLRLARGLTVRASVLDAVMWHHMRRWGHLAS